MYNDSPFLGQVKLLLKCLPFLREQRIFALKGGTAINLFLQEMPRLSVDIDLVYLPIEDRRRSLSNISRALHSIANAITKNYPNVLVKEDFSNDLQAIVKLYVYQGKAMIKIEPNFILRGALYPLIERNLCNKAATHFQVFINNIPVLDPAEIYAGKLCAALDRQHPRDLFDIRLLYEKSGITEKIRQAFVVYLASSPRSISDLLAPNLIDISHTYQKDFLNMTEETIPLRELLATRERLITELPAILSEKEKQFLLSLKQGSPDYHLLPFSHLPTLPGLQWKLLNIQKMTKSKQNSMIEKLKAILQL